MANSLKQCLREAEILAELGHERLAAIQSGELRGTVNSGTGFATSVSVPQRVVEELRSMLGRSAASTAPTPATSGADGYVRVPAMISMGDVDNHRDSWGGRPNSQVHSHTVLVWLQGAGSQLILQSRDEQQVVEALPGRLVAFSNKVYSHSVRQGIPNSARAMLGPMALHSSGALALYFLHFLHWSLHLESTLLLDVV